MEIYDGYPGSWEYNFLEDQPHHDHYHEVIERSEDPRKSKLIKYFTKKLNMYIYIYIRIKYTKPTTDRIW